MMTLTDEHRVKELLAVIHGDGGHHTRRIGYTQSIVDAHYIITELRIRLDKAEFDLRQERADNAAEWRRHDCYPRDGND